MDPTEVATALGDAYYREHERRRDAELVIANIRALAEEWRYKGEFGWGPWQAGEGPDHEGEVLDRASAALRALLPAVGVEVGRAASAAMERALGTQPQQIEAKS